MESPDDIRAWSDGQIEVEIASSVGSLDFVCEWVGSAWVARIEVPGSESVEPKVVYQGESVDRRLALLNVYGYLWLKEQPAVAQGSMWDPTGRRPGQAPVRKREQDIRDPEDLDPEQVAAVYGIRHPEANGD